MFKLEYYNIADSTLASMPFTIILKRYVQQAVSGRNKYLARLIQTTVLEKSNQDSVLVCFGPRAMMDTNSCKPESLCRVCGDKASGKHYGVPSCDGCRGFFKRSIRRNLDYVCKENGRCIVDVTRRNQCQACRFSKCLRVNMKKDAVQHERAPRPAVAVQHHLALQKLGYSFTRQQPFFPPTAPLAFSTFPSFHTYNSLTSTPDSLPSVHSSFLDSSFQDFPNSRLPEQMPAEITQLNPLLSTQVGPLNALNPFKIPLFSTALHYPVPHPGYFPTNMFYPPVVSTDNSAASIEHSNEKPMERDLRSPKFHSALHSHVQKPDSQHMDKIKEDEVSSSEEAFKKDGLSEDPGKEDSRRKVIHFSSNFEPPAHVLSRNSEMYTNKLDSDQNDKEHISDRQKNVHIAESTKRNIEDIQIEKSRKLIRDTWIIPGEEIYDPVAKLLVVSIKWLHTVASFVQLKSTEQATLLHSNWRELFLLTASQYSFSFEEGQISSQTCSNRPNIKEELKKLIFLLDRISHCKLDQSEYDWLKSSLLFRADAAGSFSSQMEIIQDQTLMVLQKHCSTKEPSRLGRIMLLLPSICSFANHGLLEYLLFPSSSDEEIKLTLSRILLYTSM
ncbi:uncharacterized protein ACR2FA_003929 [Aphomia sociella]